MVKEFDKNEWALILGGSSGLGLATAKKLAFHGLNICVVHRNPRSQLSEINKEFDVIKSYEVEFLSYNKDVIKQENQQEILEAIKNKGKIKLLLHSIAKGNLKPMVSDAEPTLKTDDFLLTLNSMAVNCYDWTQAIYQQKLFAKNSRVIAFTSEGSSKAWKNYAAVSAAKAALESIIRSIALEFAPSGIRANCIQAGVTDTESLRRIPGSENLKSHSVLRNPFQKLTTPEEVAKVVYLLCKPEANWINGTVIKADGGESLT